MTNAEAKEIVKRIKGYMGDGECWSESEFMAMDKAIKALEVLEDMPTMVYPQVDGITPTVVMPSEVNTIIENQEEMDRLKTAHLFGTLGGCYTSNSTNG